MTSSCRRSLSPRMCFNLSTNFCGGGWMLVLRVAAIFYLTQISLAAASSATVINFTNRSTAAGVGCLYGGRRYKIGSEVATAERCLQCLCLAASATATAQLVCRLRVCRTLPDPPPAGCILLQRTADCCPSLVCNHDGAVNENSILEGRSRNGNPVLSQNGGGGCLHNGTVYAEGSAMSTSSLCEYCYCIRGRQHCVRPQCVLAMQGCQPVYTKHACCPVKYNCSHAVSTTTSQPILQRNTGCYVNGSHYEEGARLEGVSKCETCYCVQGVVKCQLVTCSVPGGARGHCAPLYSNHHCCPTSYKCDQQGYEEMTKETRNYNSKDEDKTVDLASERKSHTPDTDLVGLFTSRTTGNGPKRNDPPDLKAFTTTTEEYNSTTTVESTVITTVESGTDIYVTTIDPLTTEVGYTETTSDHDDSSTLDSTEVSTTAVESTTLDTVTTSEPFLPTVLPSSTVQNDVNSTVESLKSSNESSTTTVKSLPPELEAILNSTQNKENSEEYDYDYNESSLPPSLPNLRIIPFVAADAVVAKTENSGANYPGLHGPNKPLLPTAQRKTPYYKLNHLNRFSPPTETQGGFVPKEPTALDNPLYGGKLEFPYQALAYNIEITVPPVPADQPLPPPPPSQTKVCLHNGQRYEFGDVVSDVACSVCVCYFGEVVCQDSPLRSCSKLQSGCTRIRDPSLGCCGRIVCGTNDLDSPTRVIDQVTALPPHYSTSSNLPLPAFTIADIVSTPDPFRDVIRTEPAPDLPSLIHLWDQTTSTPTSSLPSITTGGSDEDNKVLSTFENNSSSSTGNDYSDGYNNNKMQNSISSTNKNNNFNDSNSESMDSLKINNGSNAIDRIDVGFTSSEATGEEEEEVDPTPIFKSNKTRTKPNHEVTSSQNVESVIVSTVPSKVAVNSKPLPTIEVFSQVNETDGSKVDDTRRTTSSGDTNKQQSTSVEHVVVSSSTETKSASASSPVNKILSNFSTPLLESSTKSSDPSSFLFSTDDVDDSEAELKNEESDYSDNFSLDSVFKFFFDSGSEASEASTVKIPASETVTPSISTSTSRKPVSLKTPIFPVTTFKPSNINKTTVTPSKISTTTTRPPVNVSPYFSSRITAKPVKDIIHNTHRNVSSTNNQSRVDDLDEKQQEIISNHDVILESVKLRTEKPIIYINRFHSVTNNDHKSRNRTGIRVPGTITRIPPSGTVNRTSVTGNKTGAVTSGNKVEVRTSSNGTVNKYNSINRTPGAVNRTATVGGIIKPLNRVVGVYSRVPGTVSRTTSTTTTTTSSPKTIISKDEEAVQHISAVQPTTADPSAVTGLLKLAGCNIYGRMYRVGKIITELSGPCLECMCTEVGVQCRPLSC